MSKPSQKEKNHELSLFIFRRDLRLDDNTGLIRALSESDSVIPLFICTPTQVSDQNKFKSSNAIQFMIESLYDLDQQISDFDPKCKLWVSYGPELNIINKIYREFKFSAIYVNADYTPYSIKRDKAIEKFCRDHSIDFISETDVLLIDTLNVVTKSGTYYRIFTQFYKKVVGLPIRKPNYHLNGNFEPPSKKFKSWRIGSIDKYLLKKKFYEKNDEIVVKGGRTAGLHIFKTLKKFKTYSKTRDILSIDTTMLSAHNKFGTVSIREVYYSVKSKTKSRDLLKQLYWRDFYYYIGFHFMELFHYEHIFRKVNKRSNIKWEDNRSYFNAWKNAQTGFPIVDAAMTQLNETGFMHNRGRLIVANFLTKDLLVNWKYGEQYFSKKLVDIDRAQNTGNWNWSSSFGLDPTTFLRIFNPWTQSKVYDPDCLYIKKWLPELSNVEPKHLHEWYKYHAEYPNINYPKPIVQHSVQRKKFMKFYKGYFRKN